jgi:hypothetical protein
MKPLFEVGEEVILQSRDAPQLNGEATVLNVYQEGECYVCPCCGGKVRASSLSYYLDVGLKCRVINGAEYNACFKEEALRKKPKPSDFSFNELMSELKDKQTIEV